MKRIILLIFIVILFILSILTLSSVVRAAMAPPAKEFCEDQGYDFFTEETTTTIEGEQELTITKSYCKINNELTCDAYDFYAYKCGNEYSKERPCVSKGALVWANYGDECCTGTRPYLKAGTEGQSSCTILSQTKSPLKPSQASEFVNQVERTSKAGGVAMAIFIITIVLFLGYIVMRIVFRGLNAK